MKVRMNLLVSMLAALAASGAAKAAILDAPADETNPQDAKRIIVKLDGDVAGQAIPVMVTGDVDQVMLHDVLLDTKGGNAPRQIVVRAETVGSAQDIEPGGPWIGVQFGPVPKPLASHLQLSEGQGQMVLNVLKDSPADVSGIQQYDVITAIDGVETSKDMGGFLDQIREYEPNDVMNLSLIRAGAPTQATLTVGARPDDASAYEYKYESDLDGVAQGGVFRRGGIMRKGADGNWVFDALQGDDDDAIWHALPEFDDEKFNAILKQVPFGMQRDVTVQSINGNEVRIERGDDGQITVTKITRNGDDEERTTATYADEAEFEHSDPEAYESYKNKFTFHFGDDDDFSVLLKPLGDSKTFQLKLEDDDFDFDFKLDGLDELDEHLKALLDQTQNAINSGALHDEISAAIEDAIKRGEKVGQQMRIFQKDLDDGAGVHQKAVIVQNKSMTSIVVGPDGAVTLTTRDGADEVVQHFDSVEQLKTSQPELYQRFEGILGGTKAP